MCSLCVKVILKMFAKRGRGAGDHGCGDLDQMGNEHT